jgi:hypothetical protein
MTLVMELEHIMKCPVVDEQICSIALIQIIYFEVFNCIFKQSLLILFFFGGFFPFWSIALLCFAIIFLTLGVCGIIGYLLGFRRPTIEELYAEEFEQLTPDDEFLLGAGGVSNMNDTKLSIPQSSIAFFDNNQRDFRYESLQPIERTRVGQSHEDMV